MKIKNNLLLLLATLVLSSCIVKSIAPFYTKKTINYKHEFLGKWNDNEQGYWEVLSFKTIMLNENKKSKEPFSVEEKQLLKEYEKSYYIVYEKNDKREVFIATPFTIDNQYFLDFTPFGYDNNKSSLIDLHAVHVHSLVKLDFNDKKIELKWFDEDKLANLFKEDRIKIKYEKVGAMKDEYLLTASSEELQKFIKKYMTSNTSKKWETSVEFTLIKQ